MKELDQLPMRKLNLLLTALCLVSFSSGVKADMFTPSDSCSPPWNGKQASQYEIDSFKRCIENFVDEMNDAASKHRNAANSAIRKWNSFARGY